MTQPPESAEADSTQNDTIRCSHGSRNPFVADASSQN